MHLPRKPLVKVNLEPAGFGWTESYWISQIGEDSFVLEAHRYSKLDENTDDFGYAIFGDYFPSLEEAMKHIAGIIEKRDREKRTNALKNHTCPTCGTRFSPMWKFCTECGDSLLYPIEQIGIRVRKREDEDG